MKKTIIFLLLSLCFFTACVSSSNLSESLYTVKELDFTDGASLVTHKKEITILASETKESTRAGESKTVVWQGQSFTGTYQKTTQNGINTRLHYQMENIGGFSIDSATGKLTSLLFYEKEGEFDGLTAKTETELRRIADNTLKTIVGDTSDNFRLTFSDAVVTGEEYQIYEYKYHRYLGDLKTEESVLVMVSSFGTLKLFRATAVGDFDEVPSTYSYDNAAVESALIDKLDTIYKDIKAKYTVSYTVKDTELILIDENTKGLLCTVSVLVKDYDGKPSAGVTVLPDETQRPTDITESVKLVVYLE